MSSGLARRGRSIPACAGEPLPRRGRGWRGWVYPRVCGGTLASASVSPPCAGLSPRVRGNPVDEGPGRALAGSIPACAGEPDGGSTPPTHIAVYPRVCGGTLCTRCWGGIDRSIPACAGEPWPLPTPPIGQGVYPRVCGGTHGRRCGGAWSGGLSPRVRGNRPGRRSERRRSRSIPACAGEPSYCTPWQ